MTREQFAAEMTSVSSLISFCRNNEYYHLVDDIYNKDRFSDYMMDEMRQAHSWRSFVNFANSVPESDYDFYRVDEWGEVEAFDDDEYDDLYDEVYDALARDDFFEDDEDEDLIDLALELMQASRKIQDPDCEEEKQAEKDTDDLLNFLSLA